MFQIASRSDHYCSTRHYSLCLYLLEVVQNVEALQKVLNLDLLGQRHDVLLKNSPDKLRIDLVPADARIPPRADSLIHVNGALCSLCSYGHTTVFTEWPTYVADDSSALTSASMFCANVLVLSTTRRMFCFSTSGCQTTQPAAARAWVALYASTCLRGRCPNQRQVRIVQCRGVCRNTRTFVICAMMPSRSFRMIKSVNSAVSCRAAQPSDATVAVGDGAESAFLYRTELRLRDEEPEVDPRRDRLQDLRI